MRQQSGQINLIIHGKKPILTILVFAFRRFLPFVIIVTHKKNLANVFENRLVISEVLVYLSGVFLLVSFCLLPAGCLSLPWYHKILFPYRVCGVAQNVR